ncbi:MAG: DUF2243 domain-containing protein, partial [Akkermansiaceae bacterium]|nr:DUF2243 domain-containing protein [Armatimonadota bacterium]
YLVTIAGIRQLFRAGGVRAAVAGTNHLFVGGLLAGAGGFNVVEGVVDHHILGIHHVRFGPSRNVYDAAFLAISAVLFGAGVALIRNVRNAK